MRQLRDVHDLRRGREHLPLRASCKPGRSEQSAKMASSPEAAGIHQHTMGRWQRAMVQHKNDRGT